MQLNVRNETKELEAVVLGIGLDIGKPLPINPMSLKHINQNTYPKEVDIRSEISTFEKVLSQNGVKVLRPQNISQTDQVFTRDIGFVVDDHFVVANMKKDERKKEIEGIEYILEEIDRNKIIEVPKGAYVEGGDVILWNDNIFVGLSERTNREGAEFLQDQFPDKKVIAVEVVTSDDPYENVLHLDCTFQPIGKDEAIIYEDGFAKTPTAILDLFPEHKLIRLNKRQKIIMAPNVFSISQKKIVVERGFTELKKELQKRDYEVFEV